MNIAHMIYILIALTITLFFFYYYNIWGYRDILHKNRALIERTLGDFDDLKLNQIDGEYFENYNMINVEVKATCPHCNSDNLSEFYPKKTLEDKVLHVCLDCQERCYL